MRRSLRARARISSKFSSGPPNGSRSQPIRILLQLDLRVSTPLASCAHTKDALSNTTKSKPRIFSSEDPWLCELEHISYADNDTTIAAVCPPLVQKVRGRNCRVWNTEISRVSEVEEISAKLQALILTDARVLQNSEINVVDSVRAQNVSSRIADALCRRDRAEQRTPTRLEYLFNTHRREIEVRVQVRTDRVADER